MKLKQLLQSLPGHSQLPAAEAGESVVTGVTADSREVMPGSIFVAVKGLREDGHRYIASAHEGGAILVVGEDSPPNLQIPYLRVPDARLALSALAAAFQGDPSHSMVMLGVTGTSGKTTTSYVLEAILAAAGHRVGVIGTVSIRSGGRSIEATHTTPGPVELQGFLARMQADGCTAVVMEVSSHALKQHRVAHVAFDGMIFTNLSPEHLDFHPDMEDYYLSKRLLFVELAKESLRIGKNPVGVAHEEDVYGQRLLQELQEKAIPGYRHLGFGLQALRRLEISSEGIALQMGEGDEALQLQSPLIGRFNALNVLAAATLARAIGIENRSIRQGVLSLKSVPGRLEPVTQTLGMTVLVDYAHKPDALEKVLQTLGELKKSGRIITVVGCGGDRDRTKRPVMARIAHELSDRVLITSDNPRTEDPMEIIREMLSGIQNAAENGSEMKVQVEPDRKKAIFRALEIAQPGDLILIAGKGHETYQILPDPTRPGGTRKVHFDDREVALEAIRHRQLDTRF